jgi:hypothetical protein
MSHAAVLLVDDDRSIRRMQAAPERLLPAQDGEALRARGEPIGVAQPLPDVACALEPALGAGGILDREVQRSRRRRSISWRWTPEIVRVATGTLGSVLRPFSQVDVFTTAPYSGNPAAVVLDGSDLTTTEMQRFAH